MTRNVQRDATSMVVIRRRNFWTEAVLRIECSHDGEFVISLPSGGWKYRNSHIRGNNEAQRFSTRTSRSVPPTSAPRAWTISCGFVDPNAYLLVSPVQILWSDQAQPILASLKDGRATMTKSTMTITGIESSNREFRGVITKRPGRIGETDYTTPWTLDSNFANNPIVGCVRFSDWDGTAQSRQCRIEQLRFDFVVNCGRRLGNTRAIMVGMADRTPGEGKYAQVEREQRWLVPSVPAEAKRIATIDDRYILGTSLRLRRTETENGTTYKFCQKMRCDPRDPMVVKITNMYVSLTEYTTLSMLPAAELSKVRWRLPMNEREFAIDVFCDRHSGLVLAEVELNEHEAPLGKPSFATIEVTHDDRFSGGALVFATDDQLFDLFTKILSPAADPKCP